MFCFSVCVVVLGPFGPTEHRTGGRSEGFALQALSVQEAAVGGAGVASEVAGPVQGAQEQEHGALVVAHKVGFTCKRKRRVSPAV